MVLVKASAFLSKPLTQPFKVIVFGEERFLFSLVKTKLKAMFDKNEVFVTSTLDEFLKYHTMYNPFIEKVLVSHESKTLDIPIKVLEDSSNSILLLLHTKPKDEIPGYLSVDCSKLETSELEKLINKQLKDLAITLSDSQKKIMFEYFNYDFYALANFTDKLVLYSKQFFPSDEEFLDVLGGQSLLKVDEVWNYYIQGNLDRLNDALRIVEIPSLLGYLSFKITNLVRYHELKSKSLSSATISSQMGLPSFVVSSLDRDLESLQSFRVWTLRLNLLDWDYSLKTGKKTSEEIKRAFILSRF